MVLLRLSSVYTRDDSLSSHLYGADDCGRPDDVLTYLPRFPPIVGQVSRPPSGNSFGAGSGGAPPQEN